MINTIAQCPFCGKVVDTKFHINFPLGIDDLLDPTKRKVVINTTIFCKDCNMEKNETYKFDGIDAVDFKCVDSCITESIKRWNRRYFPNVNFGNDSIFDKE